MEVKYLALLNVERFGNGLKFSGPRKNTESISLMVRRLTGKWPEVFGTQQEHSIYFFDDEKVNREMA